MSVHEQPKTGLFAVAAIAAAFWVVLIFQTWSHVPFWPDAAGYTSHVAEGRWVAHPPGYPFFVALGHGFHALGLAPYPAVQAASLFLTLATLPLLFFLFRRTCSFFDTVLLTIIFAFSWNVLLLSRTGTSHAADFASVSALLLIATSRDFREGKKFYLALYGLAIVACAGFRLTTAIMMAPFFAVVLFRHRHSIGLWITCALAGLTIIIVQLQVIRLSGGWEPYSAYSHSMHLGNLPSSILLSGINGSTQLNLARTIGWWALSIGPLVILPLMVPWNKIPPLTLNQRELLLYGGASALGCLGMGGLYLCTHPGYISAALPGTFACLAALLPFIARQAWKTGVFTSCIILDVAFFLLARPIPHPASPRQAVANGLLLQYTGSGVKNSLFKTTSGWLRDAGHDDKVPKHRREVLDQEASTGNYPSK